MKCSRSDEIFSGIFVGIVQVYFVYSSRWSERGESAIQDEVLIEKIKKGNEQALRMLIEKYKNLLYHIIYKVIRDEKEAEDLTQETFIKMVDALPSYEQKGFKTWLSRIAFRTALDARRVRERRQEALIHESQEHHSGTESAEEDWLKKERKNAVARSITELPLTYKDVVHAYYIEGKSYTTIAKEQEIAEKTVEMRLYRARKWMKENWKEEEF